MEIYVYNQADDDWYCHHDYILDAPPLCLEPVQYDPGNNETGKVNIAIHSLSELSGKLISRGNYEFIDWYMGSGYCQRC